MIKIYKELEQGSDEWFAARCGLLTASEMKLILTPTLKIASNDKERAHIYELAAQRVTNYVEPTYIGDEMMRGHIDEIRAKEKYSEQRMEIVEEIGFITNDKWGFTIGYSPDGLINDDGLIECKSRRQKFQMEVITSQKVPDEHVLQLQTGLLVSERKWVDYISYCGGMPMCVLRVYPDEEIQDAILAAATKFEERLQTKLALYEGMLKNKELSLYPTERKVNGDVI